jgi:hypothetical protein
VKAPAIVMMVCAGLGAALQLVAMIMNILGAGVAASQGTQSGLEALTSGVVGMVGNVIGILMTGFCIFGLLKMMKLESRGLAYAGVIASMVPCTGSCWCLNLFIGIWALIALSDPTVKDAFR